MLCTDKGSKVLAQYCSEWTELWYGMLQGLIPLLQDDRTRVVRVYCHLHICIIDWLLMFVNQTQVGADLQYLLLRITYGLKKIDTFIFFLK